MDIKDLTPEQMEKARACTTADELIALAKDEGLELSDEQLEGIAGGSWDDICTDECPSNSSCPRFGKRWGECAGKAAR